MKIHKSLRPELAVSKDQSRYVLTEPWLDAENKVIVATDGRHMVVVPVEIEEGDTSGHVSAEALAGARKDKRDKEFAIAR